ILVIMDRKRTQVFTRVLDKAESNLVNELLEVRNRWAHQQPLSGDDTDRALDSMARLLTAVSTPEADDIGKMKMELRLVIFEEQMRTERRKTCGGAIEGQATGTLKPWREVVSPYR